MNISAEFVSSYFDHFDYYIFCNGIKYRVTVNAKTRHVTSHSENFERKTALKQLKNAKRRDLRKFIAHIKKSNFDRPEIWRPILRDSLKLRNSYK